jgi:hypothetical protein
MRRSALELVLALQLHSREHHEFPASLQELVERGYLKSVPIDTYGKGEPFRYRRESPSDRGAIVWSIGPDEIDQNGVEAERWDESGDWVVHVTVPGTAQPPRKPTANQPR